LFYCSFTLILYNEKRGILSRLTRIRYYYLALNSAYSPNFSIITVIVFLPPYLNKISQILRTIHNWLYQPPVWIKCPYFQRIFVWKRATDEKDILYSLWGNRINPRTRIIYQTRLMPPSDLSRIILSSLELPRKDSFYLVLFIISPIIWIQKEITLIVKAVHFLKA